MRRIQARYVYATPTQMLLGSDRPDSGIPENTDLTAVPDSNRTFHIY